MFETQKKQGNDLYISVKSKDINKTDLKILKEAELHYLKAFTFASTDDEKSSIQKNLMMVELKRLLYVNQDFEYQINQFNLALIRYYEAKSFGEIENCKPQKWISDLGSTVSTYLKNMCQDLQKKGYKLAQQVTFLSQLKEKVQDQRGEFKVKIFFQIIKIQEQIIEEFKTQKNLNKAENEFFYYSQNVQQANLIAEESNEELIKIDIQDRLQQLSKGQAEYDAIRLLNQGKNIFQECLKQKQQQSSYKMIDSEEIWQAIDLFKSLIKNYEGNYFMIEGEAFANLGFIQQEMFGNQSTKFREYMHSAVTLGLSIDSYCSEDWFVKSKNTLKILQKQEIERDQALRDKWRQENKELYDKVVEEKSKGVKSFIQWIMVAHKSPNQDEAFVITESDYSNMKKTLLRVIRLYHSDKIINQTEHFKNIAREIMFILNAFFETYK
ncbi:hypothetical protein ABPG72_004454 [Tetrahymena utriculariae]